MKLLLAIVVLVVFALSFWADHKWRQWMKSRVQSDPDRPHDHPSRRA